VREEFGGFVVLSNYSTEYTEYRAAVKHDALIGWLDIAIAY
jgi:hypothetical protein